MPKLKRTDLSLRTLKPATSWDTPVPAFGIRVQKHRRTFLVMMGHQRKRIPLGHGAIRPCVSRAEIGAKRAGADYACGSPAGGGGFAPPGTCRHGLAVVCSLS